MPISLAPSAFMSNADRHDRRAKAIYAPVGGSRMINVDVNSFNKMGSVFLLLLFLLQSFPSSQGVSLERGAHLVLPPALAFKFAIVVAPWESPAILGIPILTAKPRKSGWRGQVNAKTVV